MTNPNQQPPAEREPKPIGLRRMELSEEAAEQIARLASEPSDGGKVRPLDASDPPGWYEVIELRPLPDQTDPAKVLWWDGKHLSVDRGGALRRSKTIEALVGNEENYSHYRLLVPADQLAAKDEQIAKLLLAPDGNYWKAKAKRLSEIITDDQEKIAAKDEALKGAVSLVETLVEGHKAKDEQIAKLQAELKLWKPLTPEEAEAELAAIGDIPISDEEVDSIVAKVLDPARRPTEPENVKLAAKVKQLQAELAEERAQCDKLASVLELNGYRRCDAPACNCGGYHGGHALARLAELAALRKRVEDEQKANDTLMEQWRRDIAKLNAVREKCQANSHPGVNVGAHGLANEILELLK